MKKFGYGKGALSKVAEEAIINWIFCEKATPTLEGDPVGPLKVCLRT